MGRGRVVALVVVLVLLVGAGLVVFRGDAKTCPGARFGRHGKLYAISSPDIGGRVSCGTARAVALDSARRHFARYVRGWTIVYHRDCQCRTATRRLGGRLVTFTFNAT